MFAFIKRAKARQQVVDKFAEVQVNLENNYKDLAIMARKELDILIEELYEQKYLTDADYSYYKDEAQKVKDKMEGYDHTNISKFLKDRY